MKREKITQNMDMVDSTGVVRHITVTVERDPGIRVGVALVGYFDEDNLYYDFIGQLVKRRPNLERVDLDTIKKVSA